MQFSPPLSSKATFPSYNALYGAQCAHGCFISCLALALFIKELYTHSTFTHQNKCINYIPEMLCTYLNTVYNKMFRYNHKIPTV